MSILLGLSVRWVAGSVIGSWLAGLGFVRGYWLGWAWLGPVQSVWLAVAWSIGLGQWVIGCPLAAVRSLAFVIGPMPGCPPSSLPPIPRHCHRHCPIVQWVRGWAVVLSVVRVCLPVCWVIQFHCPLAGCLFSLSGWLVALFIVIVVRHWLNWLVTLPGWLGLLAVARLLLSSVWVSSSSPPSARQQWVNASVSLGRVNRLAQSVCY